MEEGIRIELNPFVTDVLRSQVHALMDDITPRMNIPSYILDEDLDMAAVWQSGLRDSLQEDCSFILEMLEEDSIQENGYIEFSIPASLGIIRACSALRLKIKENYLYELSDEELEEGDVDFDCFSEQAQKSYLTYSVLANLQMALLVAIDPDLEDL